MFYECYYLTEPNLILSFSFSSSPSVSDMLKSLGNVATEKYNLYVTQEAYDYLTNMGNYGAGKFKLTVKE